MTFSGFGVAADAFGNVYATGSLTPCNGSPNSCTTPSVLQIAQGQVTVAAGDSSTQVNIFNCGPMAATSLALTGVAVDPSGNFYVAESGNGPLFFVSGGIANFYDGCEDFGASGIAATSSGSTYVALKENFTVI